MPRGYSIAAVVLAAITGCAQAATPADHVWKTYANVRFAYSTCYPSDLMTPQPEAPNSDGRKFIANDGAMLLVYGGNNALSTSVADAAAQTQSRLAGSAGTTTYKAVKPTWFVVSGSSGGSDFYAKSFHAGDRVKSFELTYPANKASTWGPIAGRLNACFRSLKQ